MMETKNKSLADKPMASRALLLALILMLNAALLAGCGTSGPTSAPPANDPEQSSVPHNGTQSLALQVKVTIEVDVAAALEAGNAVATEVAPNGELYNGQVSVDEGANVLDALRATGLVISTTASSFGDYVSAIQSIASGDDGPESGWVFYVNGESAMESAGAIILQDGDTVRWEYVTSFE